MDPREDEPDDVRFARPVASEVKKGQDDARGTVKLGSPARIKAHRCVKEKPTAPKTDCCEVRRKKNKVPKTATVYMLAPPCKYEREMRVPRQCFNKKEYIDFLATPAKKCADTCIKQPVERRIVPMNPRIAELAKPMKRRLVLTLEDKASILPANLVANLIDTIEGETALTPEQAENFVRTQELSKSLSKPPPKTKSQIKCPVQEKQSRGSGEPDVDNEAAQCQYLMALRFVHSILNWKCKSRREDFAEIASVILGRLSNVLEYCPIGNEDRKSQQMRLLADLVACWIAEVLIEVAGKKQDEIADQCKKKRLELEVLAAREAELRAAIEAEMKEDVDDVCGLVNDDCDDETQTCPIEGKIVAEEGVQCKVQEEPPQEDQSPEPPSETSSTTSEEAPVVCLDACTMITATQEKGVQTECPGHVDAETGACVVEKEPVPAPEPEVQKIASCISDALQTDVPFVTLAKILETLYCMIYCETENCLADPMDNRVHRAIFEVMERLLKKETPELWNERFEDLVDVLSGKIARWLRRTLNAQQIRFLDQNPAEVESVEVREWSKWLTNVAQIANDWSDWINKVTKEACCMKEGGQITRGHWQCWTGKFETNALLWRRTYLEAVHQQHHNTMMMTDRKVTKTGKKTPMPEFKPCSEIFVKKTDFPDTCH